MTNAKFPLANMPPFTPEQLAWLRGFFYEELRDPSIDRQAFAAAVAVNNVVLTIEGRMSAKRSDKDNPFAIT